MIVLDKFEVYLFNKIGDYKGRMTDNEGSPEVVWALNNCLEEFMEILSEYNLNYKNF